jgi:hypothetical protein
VAAELRPDKSLACNRAQYVAVWGRTQIPWRVHDVLAGSN